MHVGCLKRVRVTDISQRGMSNPGAEGASTAFLSLLLELFDHILVVEAELADDGSFCARHAVLEKAERCVGGDAPILPSHWLHR